MIRVFVADDHAIVRDGLRRLLAGEPGMELVGETHRGHVVLERAGVERWDVLVLDLSLSDIGGIEVLRRVREQVPTLRVVVLSMYPEEQYAARLLRMGASAYLSKGRSSDEIIRAIRAAAQGRRYVTPTAADALLTPGDDRPAHERLSPREHQLFVLVLQGRAPGDIAAELALTPSTVSSHLARIREKLGVRTNGEVMQYAWRAGLVPAG